MESLLGPLQILETPKCEHEMQANIPIKKTKPELARHVGNIHIMAAVEQSRQEDSILGASVKRRASLSYYNKSGLREEEAGGGC